MAVVAPSVEAPAVAATRTRFLTLRTAAKSPTFIVGMVILLFWIACALWGRAIAPKDAFADYIKTGYPRRAKPGGDFLLGTDDLGRDVLSRVIVGSKDILTIAPLATLLGTVLGTALGLVTGYYRRWVDLVVSRIIDAFLAIPLLLLALVVITARGSQNTRILGVELNLTVTIVIGVAFAPIIARTVRSAVLAQTDLDYVQAARLRGENGLYVMFREILPNVLGPILVEFTVRLGYAIFSVVTLSFHGVGVQDPSAVWGLSVSKYYGSFNPFWWPVVFPCLAIASLVVAVNLVADALQEAQR